MDKQFIFGYREEWQAFESRNAKFMARFPNLKAALDVAFLRAFATSGPEARTIFMLGRLCSEEFFEILLLAANGYGYGALKLLRSLFERAITLAYLSENPGEVDAFLDYHAVAQYKLMKALQDTFGPDALPKDKADETGRTYQRLKDAYLITDCATCKTKRVNHTWHKLDVVSMAKKTAFGALLVPAYYVPLAHAHSTVGALLARLEDTDDGGMGFNPDLQPKQADLALQLAHNIMLGVIETQKNFFKLDALDQPLQTCLQDFMDIWKGGERYVCPPRCAKGSQT
jgi:hypothetical protein